MWHRRVLSILANGDGEKSRLTTGYDHIQVFGEEAKSRLTEALAREGIDAVEADRFGAVPTRIHFVTVSHRFAERARVLRDSLGLDRESSA